MRKFGKLAAAVAAVGLAAFGTVAAGGGAASAATHKSGVTFSVGQSVTGCTTDSAQLTLNVFPTCTSTDSTVLNPTSFTITADPSFFSTISVLPGINTLLALLNQSLEEDITYTLSCSVNGQTATFDGTFTATTNNQSQTVNLQDAVGSPLPNSCRMESLKATSLVSLSAPLRLLLNGKTFTFGVTATTNTVVPGAIWMSAGKTSAGASAGICVDVANNGNVGSTVQVYQCNSALAQMWAQTSNGQIVHNGVCLQQSSTKAILAKCSITNKAQMWTINGTGGIFNTVVNHSTSQCLTAPSPKNFTQITVGNCTGTVTQRWTGPAKAPV